MGTDRISVFRTVALVLLVAGAAGLLVSATHEWTRDKIAANERARVVARLRSVVETMPDAGRFVSVEVAVPPAASGTRTPDDAFVMFADGRAQAVVLAVTAPDGYNAPIRLLVGLDLEGIVTGVRVVSHKETPGLGDAIDIEKSDWIEQFTGTSLSAPRVWAVDKDDGPFDSLTGATITPRAVVAGVHSALEYFGANASSLVASAEPPSSPPDSRPAAHDE
jgi:H+/Na+-translocating ferredoxin:NAD+ oxidoreductase subunit G